jgi:anti-anti-sigma factor
MNMHIKVEKELTVYNVEEVIKKIKNEIEQNGKMDEFTLDLTDIEDMDAAGLQLLISLQKYADSNDCDCKVVITKELKEIFVKYGALDVLEFEVNNG